MKSAAKKLALVFVVVAMLGACRSGSLLCQDRILRCPPEPVIEYPGDDPQMRRDR